ncbi:MAG TPA: LysE family translocator [Pseudonocardiaceae bacterium]
MTWAAYGSFLGFATILVLMPGPDFAVVTKNTLAGGRLRGLWSGTGVASSNAVQGLITAAGLGVLILRVEPLFLCVKWAGIAYLAFLAVQAFRSALRGDYAPNPEAERENGRAWRGWRQGFLSNITNPKVLAFYLAVLPQFLGPHASLLALIVFALSHAVLSLLYLTLLVTVMNRARHVLSRRRVRRCLDAATGTALLGFSAKLAAEHA